MDSFDIEQFEKMPEEQQMDQLAEWREQLKDMVLVRREDLHWLFSMASKDLAPDDPARMRLAKLAWVFSPPEGQQEEADHG